MLDIETLKWLVGTVLTAVSVYLAFLQLKKSGDKSGDKSASTGAAPRNLAPQGTQDLQETLKIIASIDDANDANRKRVKIIKTAISRDEFDFALEVLNQIDDPNVAGRCKKLLIDARQR